MGWNWLERHLTEFCIDRTDLYWEYLNPASSASLILSLSLSNLTQNQNKEIIQLQIFDAFRLQFELDFFKFLTTEMESKIDQSLDDIIKVA